MIKMAEFLIFFACDADRRPMRTVSINFLKNLCKKVNLFGTHPVRNSWIRAYTYVTFCTLPLLYVAQIYYL